MVDKLRNGFYSLKIGIEKEEVWLKKLRNILQSDIHKKPLGCKISNTHVKIGDYVHLDSFYEAQILFSHPRWINYFSKWVIDSIKIKDGIKRIVLVGYETYSEQLLFQLRRRWMKKNYNVEYCIYEEPRFSKGKEKSHVNMRYFDSVKKDLESEKINGEDILIIYLCGISSTLNTFVKMKQEFENSWDGDASFSQVEYRSIVQVLPHLPSEVSSFDLGGVENISWNIESKTVSLSKSEDDGIESKFLVNVECKWHRAGDCKLCFPTDIKKERPIIYTDESSVVPVQMINLYSGKGNTKGKESGSLFNYKINFFEKEREKFLFEDYLYYGHISRDDRHYQYYIRTGHFFKDLLNNKFATSLKKFQDFCTAIKDSVVKNDKDVNIIISPFHFSSEKLANAINQYVFNNNAHIISFNPKKEFRSNFETKYSNIEYFIEQLKNYDFTKKPKINFYYVDDQINTGATFYRTKSLVSSLMEKGLADEDKDLVRVFDAIIVLVNRMSNSSKRDYVKDKIDNFFSLIDIDIPSIRNYDDSCPMCRMQINAEKYKKSCALDITVQHWDEKIHHHQVKTLEEAKLESEKSDPELRERRFRRFYCENEIWRETKQCETEEDYLTQMVNVIKEKNTNVEYFISFIKTISRPFIYYKENAKKASLKILLSSIEALIESAPTTGKLLLEINSKEININLPRRKENYYRYTLLVILINCLSSIDSTYILNIEKIVKMYNVVAEWEKSESVEIFKENRTEYGNRKIPSVLQFISNNEKLIWKEGHVEHEVESFYTVILSALKRVICGISGKAKSKRIEKQLREGYISWFKEKDKRVFCYTRGGNNQRKDLALLSFVQALFLENINTPKSLTLNDELKNENILSKYQKISEKILDELMKEYSKSIEMNISFYYYDKKLNSQLFHISDTCEQVDISNESFYERLFKQGFYVDYKLNRFLFSFVQYDINDNQRSVKNGIIMSLDLTNSTNKTSFKKLELVRFVLRYRYFLNNLIKKDLYEGTIKSAIQANRVKTLLDSDKLMSHGGIKDISDAFNIAVNLIFNDKGQIADKLSLIRVFMNLCISHNNAELINKRYFGQLEESHFSPFLERLKPESNIMLADKNEEAEFALTESIRNKFLKDYILYLIDGCENEKYQICTTLKCDNNKNRVYYNSYCSNSHRRNTVSKEELINEVIIQLNKYNSIPSFLGKYFNIESKGTICMLVGIISMFFQNIKKHGDIHKTINLTFDFSDDKSYNIIVENHCHNQSSKDNGITHNFFKEISEDGKFVIIMESNDKKEKKYVSELKVFRRNENE